MAKLRSANLGHYVLSFFEMHVDTWKSDMTINKLPPKDMTILFHEYIHFLQDFTTYYGLNQLYVQSEYLHSVVNRIYKIQSETFTVPFKIEDNTDNVLLNKQICKLTLGDTVELKQMDIVELIEDSDTLMDNSYMKVIPNVIISCKDDMLIFGSMAIMESMAYIMERLCSPNDYEESPDFPYKSAEKVASYYSPDFGSDPLKVLALCDMSLQSSNPGSCFVRTMKGIQAGSIQFKTPEEIYDYFYSQKAQKAQDKRIVYFMDSFNELSNVVKDLMKSYYKGLPNIEVFYEWIDRLTGFAQWWRNNERYFLLNMARYDKLASNSFWGKAVHDVGTPLMSNNIDGHFYKITPKDMTLGMDVEFFKAIFEIKKLFEQGNTACSMYEWCKDSKLANCDENCKKSPWLKCKDMELCPYALTWRNWNLTGKIPVKQGY